jgi:hypothetical protein
MWWSDVVEVLGGSRESHDVHRFIHHSSSIKLTRALPPIQHSLWSDLTGFVLDDQKIFLHTIGDNYPAYMVSGIPRILRFLKTVHFISAQGCSDLNSVTKGPRDQTILLAPRPA